MTCRYTAYIGLGSNLGQRACNLLDALGRLAADDAVRVRRVSSVYETAPQGPVADQPDFLNAVAEVQSRLEPPRLLARCLEVERRMGRVRQRCQGPRNIDLDLLLVDEMVERWPGLEVPHARLAERAFVLRPLLELAPAIRDPRTGALLDGELRRVDDQPLARLGALEALARDERRHAATPGAS